METQDQRRARLTLAADYRMARVTADLERDPIRRATAAARADELAAAYRAAYDADPYTFRPS